jgi:hypothetical protein
VRALLISVAGWTVIGVAAMLVLLWSGLSPPVVALSVIALAMFGPYLYTYYWLPLRLRGLMRRLVDPDAGPPPSFQPVDDRFPLRLIEAVQSGSDALADWLADDFTMIDHRGRRHDARRYLHSQRVFATVFPDLEEHVDELRADFDVPDVLWMRSTQTGRSRRGTVLDATIWSRLTLTRDRSRIRELAFAGVVRAG